MKRKLFIMVVAVLVICLTAGVLLTACKPKDPAPVDPGGGGTGNAYSTKKALSEVISGIYDGTYKGVIFDGTAATEGGEETTLGIDAELDFVIGGDTYTLVAKGTLDIRPSVTGQAATAADVQDNSELYIGVKKNAKTLFGIGYDVEKSDAGLAPYLYLVSTDDNGATPVVHKVNGLSISDMVYASQHQATATTSVSTDDIMSFVNLVPDLLGETLFGAACQRNSFGAGGTQYVFNFNLKNTVTGLSSGIVALLNSLKDLFDLTPFLDPVVNGLKGLLPEEYQSQVTGSGSTGLQQLLNIFAGILGKNEENNVTGKFTFNFNADKSFNSASIEIDASKFVAYLNSKDNANASADTFDGKFTINIDKLVLTNDEKIDAFAGTPLEGKVGGSNVYDVHNMLDLDFEAIANGDDDEYTIEMDMDIDPFVLTEMMGVTDKVGGKVTDEGKAFWAEKMAEALSKAGTATLIVKKTAGDAIASGFDKSKVDGMTDEEAAKVIAYAKVDSFGVDVFVWDPIHGNEVSFGSDISFPMSWADVVAGITKKDNTATSSDATDTIKKVFQYAGPILEVIGPFFDAMSVKDMGLNLQYADIIDNVLKPILAAFVKDFTWVDANLYQLLAGIFGTYTPAEGDVEESMSYAEDVTFTLVSFKYGDSAIYPAA